MCHYMPTVRNVAKIMIAAKKIAKLLISSKVVIPLIWNKEFLNLHKVVSHLS